MGKILLETDPLQDDLNELTRLRLELITSNKPFNYRPNDPDNVIVSYEKGYTTLICLIEQNGTQNPGSLSCFEFYARIDMLYRKQPGKK